MSRLPLENTTTDRDDTASLFNIQQIGTLPVDPKQLRLETSNDPLLSKVLLYTKEGWPEDVDTQLRPFFRRKLEITVESGCLMWGIKVIVPHKLKGDTASLFNIQQIGTLPVDPKQLH